MNLLKAIHNVLKAIKENNLDPRPYKEVYLYDGHPSGQTKPLAKINLFEIEKSKDILKQYGNWIFKDAKQIMGVQQVLITKR